MALITTAPETISGKISAIFKSVAQLSELTERINLVVDFTDANGKPIYGVKAVYTDEDDQIAALSTQKAYGVYFSPVIDDEQQTDAVLTVEYMGETYVGGADLTDVTVLLGTNSFTLSKVE